MPTVWKIAPGDDARVFEETHAQGCITINTGKKTDLPKMPKEKLKESFGSGFGNSLWRFIHDVKRQHTVVANKGTHRVVGIGVIESAYLPPGHRKNPRNGAKDHWHTRLVNWEIAGLVDLHEKEFFGRVPGTVQLLSSEQCGKIKKAYLKAYPNDPRLREKLDRLLIDDYSAPNSSRNDAMPTSELLREFGQIILYGPPGTGKTREAKLAALALFEKKVREDVTEGEIKEKLDAFRKTGRFDLVVFHPAYEYEQFIGGIAPNLKNGNGGFKTTAGTFLNLCRAATAVPEERFVLVIDEINRGNLPKLLGELVYALEYRGEPVTLPFAFDEDDTLTIPENLYIIATMNSADRSIGPIDVAIRRRFGLVECPPRSKVVRDIWASISDDDYGVRLAALMDQLNDTLKMNGHDATASIELGVGHSYFLPKPRAAGSIAKQQVRNKWEYQVKPLLREYEQLMPSGDSLERYLLSKSLDDCLD
jgi:5-methylcytosine-specific restriction protein B